MEFERLNSVFSFKVLDTKSAVVFSQPGICFVHNHTYLPMQYSHNFFARKLHLAEIFAPIFLTYVMAVVLSVLTHMLKTFSH